MLRAGRAGGFTLGLWSLWLWASLLWLTWLRLLRHTVQSSHGWRALTADLCFPLKVTGEEMGEALGLGDMWLSLFLSRTVILDVIVETFLALWKCQAWLPLLSPRRCPWTWRQHQSQSRSYMCDPSGTRVPSGTHDAQNKWQGWSRFIYPASSHVKEWRDSWPVHLLGTD